jgi:hypothetical protein
MFVIVVVIIIIVFIIIVIGLENGLFANAETDQTHSRTTGKRYWAADESHSGNLYLIIFMTILTFLSLPLSLSLSQFLSLPPPPHSLSPPNSIFPQLSISLYFSLCLLVSMSHCILVSLSVFLNLSISICCVTFTGLKSDPTPTYLKSSVCKSLLYIKIYFLTIFKLGL